MIRSNYLNVSKQKKFPESPLSVKLLYVRSKTSRTGKAPKPLGSPFSRFILRKRGSIYFDSYALLQELRIETKFFRWAYLNFMR